MSDGARLAVLISGRGSNLVALHRACNSGQINASIALVISNDPNAGGLHYCHEHALPTRTIDHREYATRLDFDRAISAALDDSAADLVLLAGFMRVLSGEFTRRFESRMLNIHPSLLPRYRGLNTHQRAIDDGAHWHGCSVHYVTQDLDCGPVVARSAIQVRAGMSSDELAGELLAREHRLYPFVVGECINGNIQLRAGQVMYRDEVLTHPLLV